MESSDFYWDSSNLEVNKQQTFCFHRSFVRQFLQSFCVAVSSSTVQGNLTWWWWIMNEKGCGRKQEWSNLSWHPGIWMERLRKTTENLILDSGCSGLDSNLALPEYRSLYYLLSQLCSASFFPFPFAFLFLLFLYIPTASRLSFFTCLCPLFLSLFFLCILL
jgi:hypothetical protein